MKCPICEVELKMAERQGIEIDYCAQCRGVWLDRGELDKIIERTGEDAAPPAREPMRGARRDYDEHRPYRGDDDEYYKKRKRKSLLGELFDF